MAMYHWYCLPNGDYVITLIVGVGYDLQVLAPDFYVETLVIFHYSKSAE